MTISSTVLASKNSASTGSAPFNMREIAARPGMDVASPEKWRIEKALQTARGVENQLGDLDAAMD